MYSFKCRVKTMPQHPSMVASLSIDGAVSVVDVDTNNQPTRLQHPSPAVVVEWCPQCDGTLAAGTEDGQLYIWNDISQPVRTNQLNNSIHVTIAFPLNGRISRGISPRTTFLESPTIREWRSTIRVRDRSLKSFHSQFSSSAEFPSHHPAHFSASTL